MSKFRNLSLTLYLLLLPIALTSCSSDNSEKTSGILEDLPGSFFDSSEINLVKNGSVKACPYSTLSEMADAFFENPNWRDFQSDSGITVVELTGELSYSGLPATALIQFEVFGSTFETSYMGINGVDQNRLVLAGLLTKMCEAV
jgi:hypothetical protein